jgi:hypothetical protein
MKYSIKVTSIKDLKEKSVLWKCVSALCGQESTQASLSRRKKLSFLSHMAKITLFGQVEAGVEICSLIAQMASL